MRSGGSGGGAAGVEAAAAGERETAQRQRLAGARREARATNAQADVVAQRRKVTRARRGAEEVAATAAARAWEKDLTAWRRKIEAASRAYATAESQPAQARGVGGEQAVAAEVVSWQVDLRAWRDKLQVAEAEAMQALAATVASDGSRGGDGEEEEAEVGVEEVEPSPPNRAAWLQKANASVRVAQGAKRTSRQAAAHARPPSARREQAAWFTTSLATPLFIPHNLLHPLLHPCYTPYTPRLTVLPTTPTHLPCCLPVQAAWLSSMMGEIDEQREMPQAVQREWLMRQPLSCSSTINRDTIGPDIGPDTGPKTSEARRAALARGDALGVCSRPADPRLLAQAMEAAVGATPRHRQAAPRSAQSPPRPAAPVSTPVRLAAHSYSV